MNPDELENQLRSLPLRSAPRDWRNEILNQSEPEPKPGVVEWFARRPGWAAVAAVWGVSVLLRLCAPSVDGEESAGSEARTVSPQMIIQAWSNHFPMPTPPPAS